MKTNQNQPMDINFEYNGVKASERLEGLMIKRLESLQDKYSFVVNADVYFKTENTSDVATGMICVCRVNIPRSTLVSQSSKDSFESAISEAADDMRRQLEKKKGKMKTY